MILEKTTQNSIPTTEAFKMIFPEFGTKAADVPYFDSDKHMYIVDQHVSNNGHRQITYVAIGGSLLVEHTEGLYHSFTFMNKLRLMIPNGDELKVIRTFDWPEKSYFNLPALLDKIKEAAVEYAKDNIAAVGGVKTEELISSVKKMVDIIFSQDVDSHLKGNATVILKAYCRQMKCCKDYLYI